MDSLCLVLVEPPYGCSRWTLAVPGNVTVAAAGKPLSSLDCDRRAAAGLASRRRLRRLAAPARRRSGDGGDAADGGTCQNPIACENALPGVGPAVWDLPGKDAGDLSIQGFATEISVNPGETVRFKVDTDAAGVPHRHLSPRVLPAASARASSTTITNPIPQRPARLPATTPSTGLYDCGNWSRLGLVGTCPTDAVSGIYLAKLVRTDTGGASHIVFVVRDDDSTSDLLFQTSDTTWQAYNTYGGNSLYNGAPVGRAYKVSYNRPLVSRGDQGGGQASSLFNAEYPMVRWLEANGYDVSYTTGIDTDRRGQDSASTRCFSRSATTSTGPARSARNVEAARDAGVHLAFFSGNEVFWKTRWENSIDASEQPVPHAGLLQGDARQREDRPEPGLDRHVARSAAVQPRRGQGRRTR